ncbi:MAG: TlpA family protein disulfide reductase [Actinomycetota bacterium]|nr:TlpA family protein disulfide reductase [Actinomycetota bacterium]
MEREPERDAPRVRRRVAFFVAPAVAFIALLTYGVVKAPAAPQVGERAPAFSAPLLQGEGTSSLQDLRGKPLVINFWASWCEPCKAEAPLLEEAHDAYAGEVSFLGVDVRDARSDARAFVAEYGVGYPSVRDETRSIYRAYGLTGQPETFFIDSEGIIVDHVAGPLLRRDELFTMLDVLVSRDG